MTADKVWVGRGGFLAAMVGFWLVYAWVCAGWWVEEDFLARGKTTVAHPRKKTLEELIRGEERVLRFEGRIPVLKRKKEYSYVVEGRSYEDYTTGEANPVGQTITYLPEDPTVHRLGFVEPRSTAIKVCGTLLLAGLTSLFTFGFFMFCVFSSVDENPTRQGWWVILGLGTAQCALVFTTLYLVRQPFLVVLTQYVPAFVGGTIAVLLGVRLFARRRGIKLGKPPGGIERTLCEARRHFSTARCSARKSRSEP
jgi:hypothetical protein